MTTTRFQDLEKQIQTLQEEHKKQVQKLQEEIDRLKKEEQETKLPKDFDREIAIDFLSNPYIDDLEEAFNWLDTPQGAGYWDRIYDKLFDNPSYKVPEEAIIQLQKWVIMSYQQQYGN